MGRGRQKRLHDIRSFGGRGNLKCAVCGKPITEHKTMALCTNYQNGKMNQRFLIDEVGRHRMRREK